MNCVVFPLKKNSMKYAHRTYKIYTTDLLHTIINYNNLNFEWAQTLFSCQQTTNLVCLV